jgi:type IV pilus assembly protein PilC
MALSLSCGLGVEEAVDMSVSLNKDAKALNAKYAKCKELLSGGASLSDALKQSALLSARDSRMLSLGDHSGMADTAMAEIARKSDDKVQYEIAGIVSRIEPTLVIITSVIIGVILLSVMLPLISIMTALG